MKNIHIYCCITWFILSFSAYAQKETYNWFYGSGQGITWSKTQTFNGIPTDAPNTTVPLTGIPTRYESENVRPQMYPMSTREGCFTLSDGNGNLLFYSSGSSIYNANHRTMNNATGLEGHSSSAQSGIIIPLPRNKHKYVAVSIGIFISPGFAYNILDTEGEGELILPKNRNFVLPAGATKSNFVESVAATKHANGVDYWIIAIERAANTNGTSKMVAWLLTKDGVSDTPIVTVIPGVQMVNRYTAYGYLKVSPNGKYFALMMNETQNMLWGEFNNRTGTFSNMQDYRSLARSSFPTYGAEFTPDGKYLYVTNGISSTNLAYVFEFNELLRGNITPLKIYQVPSSQYITGAIQLGPDLRMYLTMLPVSVNERRDSILYMFDKPDEPLTTRVYALKNLSPGTGSGLDGVSGTRLGLPTFASSFFVEVKGTATLCVGEEARYVINSNAERIEVDFDEGEGPIIINNTDELKHSFKKPGNYLIKLRPLNGQGQPVEDEITSVYTTVYSCYLPVNHNLRNAEY